MISLHLGVDVPPDGGSRVMRNAGPGQQNSQKLAQADREGARFEGSSTQSRDECLSEGPQKGVRVTRLRRAEVGRVRPAHTAATQSLPFKSSRSLLVG